MASIEKRKRKNGATSYVVSMQANGKRQKISLDSDYTLSDAQALANAVDNVIRARKLDEPIDRKTRQYLDKLPVDLATRLSRLGFVETKSSIGVFDALNEFLEYKLKLVERSTQENYVAFKKSFLPLVDVAKKLRNFGDSDVQNIETTWKRAYAPNTVALKLIILKMFLRYWEERGVSTSVTQKIKATRVKTPKKEEFQIPKEWSEPIFAACKDQEQRALFALWRHGGLRKREPCLLTWDCVLLNERRLIVKSPKTIRYGKESRTIPLYPLIERELLALRRQTPYASNDERIFRCSERNDFQRPLNTAVKRAGFKPFACPFQNMRASFENELIADGLPAHVVAEWMGHTLDVQRRYYLRTLDSYYDVALSKQR